MGLGGAQLEAPREVARVLGIRPGKRSLGVMRAAGLHEVCQVAGILATPTSEKWDAARLAGVLGFVARRDRRLRSG